MLRAAGACGCALALWAWASAACQAGETRFLLGAGYVGEREYLSGGARYVWEDGVRTTAALEAAWSGGLVYRGALYGSLLNHRGEDPNRFTIPDGTEHGLAGHAGTKQEVRWTTPSLRNGPLRAYGGVALDVWYRPLDYYEIWIVPSVELGLRLESVPCSGCTLELGFNRTVRAANIVETTHSPWNGDANTTNNLQDGFFPVITLSVPRPGGHELRLKLEGYRTGASEVTLLSSGFGIYQPRTTIWNLSLIWVFPWRP